MQLFKHLSCVTAIALAGIALGMTGCHACGSCYDYSPPVEGAACSNCYTSRAGSAHGSYGHEEVVEVMQGSPTPAAPAQVIE